MQYHNSGGKEKVCIVFDCYHMDLRHYLGHVLFPQLVLLFDHKSNAWSNTLYKVFLESVKELFQGESWKYLGYVPYVMDKDCFKCNKYKD